MLLLQVVLPSFFTRGFPVVTKNARDRGFLTPSQIDEAKQAIDLLCSLANEGEERPNISTHDAVDMNESSCAAGKQSRHLKLKFRLRHSCS